MSKFTQEDLLKAMGLKIGDKVSVDDTYEDLFVGVVELNESSGAVGVRSEDTFTRLSEIVRNGYEYSIIIPPKYTLTETEKHIVLAIQEKWKWIARDWYERLDLFSGDMPTKFIGANMWSGNGMESEMYAFNHHFQFIQWTDEEPVSLDELREIAKGETK